MSTSINGTDGIDKVKDGTIVQADLAVGSGLVVQTVRSQSSTHTSTSASIPADNTIPQIGEGVQVLSVTITPKQPTSTLVLDVIVNVSLAAATSSAIVALFRGSTADAIAAGIYYAGSANNTDGQIALSVSVPANSTTSSTFTVRAGRTSGTSMDINGRAGGAVFGGVAFSTIEAREIL